MFDSSVGVFDTGCEQDGGHVESVAGNIPHSVRSHVKAAGHYRMGVNSCFIVLLSNVMWGQGCAVDKKILWFGFAKSTVLGFGFGLNKLTVWFLVQFFFALSIV